MVRLDALFVPDTVIWPQLVGGLIFGAGFVIGGWCPGTAAVGLGSGRIDALIFLVGAGIGSLAFATQQERLDQFLHAGDCGVCALPGQIGISNGVGAAALLGIALLAFLMVTQVEKRMQRRAA